MKQNTVIQLRGTGGFVDLRPKCACGDRAVVVVHYGREYLCAECYYNNEIKETTHGYTYC
jgi:hypothetical protein